MTWEWVPTNSIRPAEWRSTHLLKPDLKHLAASMTKWGWLYPIIVRRETSEIVDGFHRWLIAHTDRGFMVARGEGQVPVVFVDHDEIDAMVLHIDLNRPRGQIVAHFFSALIRDILASGKYDEDELRKRFHMSVDEMSLMREPSLLKARKIAEHTYSNAWVPVEAPPGAKPDAAVIERPPNADR